ncbi:MAG: four helix bundle protein [Ignavibacteriaceae bacterium]|nr:four helix bundle protein [Ignavibacterium sp.]MCC6254226.1 four helix bundle protein [Ignavibacteriaceae bacterium]HMN23861.1 four helix bundle protein [Ignavibacteriaceae bacterium]HRN27743.1 four helix bundle protein [Ignavibacteriaceae bacterium]HRP93910.1 four helix bundle protein [Ignavibacteriaceae bacterium]
MKSQSFTELIVWQKAHRFVLTVYEITKGFPKEEIYGLSSQFRRAAVSIPANIAEGYRKRSKKDKVKYFNIAEGSLEECKYYLILSKDLNYVIDNNDAFSLAEEVSKLLFAYSKAILNSDS